MTTLQEQFEKDFPNKEVKYIDASYRCWKTNFTNYDLDLREYGNLVELNLRYNNITWINISNQKDLIALYLENNCLTSADFLNHLPNPKKLERLLIFSNKIQSTDIEIFSKFVNLKSLKIGTMAGRRIVQDERNKFYGSLKSYQNLIKLEEICIEETDVDRGLEYLPTSLVEATKGREKYSKIECSPHNTDAKCSAIQDQLRPFDYDLEAWQLAHPEKMLIARPKLLADNKWVEKLGSKIRETRQELEEIKINEVDKVKKIQRLEKKLTELQKVKEGLEKYTQTETLTKDKSTQTDLTSSQIEEMEKIMEQLRQIQIPPK